jgi:hypothetical protein
VSALAPGSDVAFGTSIQVGERFLSTITARNGYWNLTTGGGFFPFMAFQVGESGTRNGTLALDLFRNGANVFSFAETSDQSFIHLGTNVVTLAGGLEFDVMRLDYTRNSSDVTSTIMGPGAVFVWPETQTFLDGRIEYLVAAVPEPRRTAPRAFVQRRAPGRRLPSISP